MTPESTRLKIVAAARQYSGRGVSFLDQGLQGLSALLISVILARYLSVVTFAGFSMMVGIHAFIFTIHRSTIVLPFILDDSGDVEAKSSAKRRSWWTANLAFIGLTSAILVVAAIVVRIIGAWFPGAAWMMNPIFYLTLTTPPLLAFEFGRRLLYQDARAGAVAIVSGVYFAGGLLCAGLGMLSRSEIVGCLSLAVAGIAGVLTFVVMVRPRPIAIGSAWKTWRPHASFAIWQSLSAIPYNAYATAPVVFVGSFAGPAAKSDQLCASSAYFVVTPRLARHPPIAY